MQVALLQWTAERQASRMRQACFEALLRQEIGWFDVHPIGEEATRLSEQTIKVQTAIASSGGAVLQFLATFIGGMIIGTALSVNSSVH